jgi:hypothetical protein
MAQALFANQREANLQSTVALVEEVLVELGHPPATSRVAGNARRDEPAPLHAWRIVQGSAVSHVTLIPRVEFTHIRVVADVMTLDEKVDRVALFEHLLELNTLLCGAAFALDGRRVWLVTERSTLDLDRSEVLELLHRITHYADDYDDALVARFGGALGPI